MSRRYQPQTSSISFNDGSADSRFPLQHNNNQSQQQAFGQNAAVKSGSSNAYANGATQNTGNVITDRSTTRIHAPPGGRSSITFGDDSTPLPMQQRSLPQQQHETTSSSYGTGYQGHAARDAPQYGQQQRQSDDQLFGANARKGSNAYANGATQNTGNVITDRSSTRLHAPPGGHSSISFGDGSANDTRFDNHPQFRNTNFGSQPQRGYGQQQQQQQQQQQPPRQQDNGQDYGQQQQQQYAPPQQQYAPQYGQGDAFGANARKGSNAYANGASQNTGNVITDRSSSRVLAPPGGHSTFRLG
ncbi:hypothetical protein M885DRAFT_531026 [Pelagophyceae sp. CCMP2097]|nr:hypothetical protein M885DRAFT_531026 [Pelagophyceae sp. CCMP2097]